MHVRLYGVLGHRCAEQAGSWSKAAGGHVILHSHGADKSWKITGDVFVRVTQHLGCLLELFNKGSKLIL